MKPRSILCLVMAGILAGVLVIGHGISGEYSALEQLRVVRVIGCDRSPEGGTALSAAVEKPGEDAAPLRLKEAGLSVREAVAALENRNVDGELVFSHVQYAVVGRDCAADSILPLLRYAEWEEHFRLGIWLFLSDAGAAELVAPEGDGSFDVAEALTAARREFLKEGGHVFDFRETAVALGEYGAAPVCLLRAEAAEDKIRLRADGYGILREGRLVGALEGGEAEALGLLRGDPGLRVRTVLDGGATMEYEGKAKLKPSWNADGSPGPLTVLLTVDAGVMEDGGKLSRAALSDALAVELKADIEAMLSHARAWDADFPALGKTLRVDGGERFYALPEDWLTRMEFEVQVEVRITRGYDLCPPEERGRGV